MKLLWIYISIQLLVIGFDISLGSNDIDECTNSTNSTTELTNINPSDDYCGGNEWFHYKDEKCFKIIKQFATYDEAEYICNKFGLKYGSYLPTLVSIKSLDEQEYLSEFIFNKLDVINNVWIGAIRRGDKFVWNDGSEIEFENWQDDLIDDNRLNCSIMLSGLDGYSLKGGLNIGTGKWKKVSCETQKYIVCQRMQLWSFPQLQYNFLLDRKDLNDTKIILNNALKQLNITSNQLNETQILLNNTIKQLTDTKVELVNTKNELVNTMNSRFEGIEGAFMTTFEVAGSASMYYPVAFQVHHEDDNSRSNPTTPLIYDIFRTYREKLPNSNDLISDEWGKGMSLTLKLLCSDGAWDGNSNALRVLLHHWSLNKAVAKVQLMEIKEYRLFVWLRGGGIRYHIRSPIDLSKGITIYYAQNSIASPPYTIGGVTYPAIKVSPITFGNEDPNLVKPGSYDGWGF